MKTDDEADSVAGLIVFAACTRQDPADPSSPEGTTAEGRPARSEQIRTRDAMRSRSGVMRSSATGRAMREQCASDKNRKPPIRGDPV